MTTLSEQAESSLQPAAQRWFSWPSLWKKSKRYTGILLTLLVLSALALSAKAARPQLDLATIATSHEQPAQQVALGRDLAHEADLRWVQGSQSDLQGLTLEGATMTGANLSGADLSRADLAGAALLGTNLGGANLSKAVLRRADLRYAVLIEADLRGADLRYANLQWVDLQYADLRGARLDHAHLHRAHLNGATLPDGTRWRPDTDMTRFIKPSYVTSKPQQSDR
jgi:uncharacterized protein YjbI with pentapeptide repeats